MPGNTTLASCKKGQVPGWGVGSIQGTGEIAPQGAGVTGDCRGPRDTMRSEGVGQRAWPEAPLSGGMMEERTHARVGQRGWAFNK